MDLPLLLLGALRSAEKAESIAVLLTDGGFNAETMAVLAAWQNTVHRWKAPKKPCPDNATATPAAWAWMLSGWIIDREAVAIGADVSYATASAKIDLLLSARLIYPDGTVAVAAGKAMRAHVNARLRAEARKGKKKKDDKDDDQAEDKSKGPAN